MPKCSTCALPSSGHDHENGVQQATDGLEGCEAPSSCVTGLMGVPSRVLLEHIMPSS